MSHYEPMTTNEPIVYEKAPDETPSEAVINAVASASGAKRVARSDAEEMGTVLDPLYSAIDPEALDSLFERAETRTSSADWQVSFSFYGYEVTVYAHGTVKLTPDSEAGPRVQN